MEINPNAKYMTAEGPGPMGRPRPGGHRVRGDSPHDMRGFPALAPVGAWHMKGFPAHEGFLRTGI